MLFLLHPQLLLAYDFTSVAPTGQILYYNLFGTQAQVTSQSIYAPFYAIRPAGNLVIPDSVEHEGITYPVTIIGEKAFWGCTGLTSVVIPNTVTTIGTDAFEDCTGLASVNIGAGVTTIGEYAFHHCTGLETITLPNTVRTIGGNAFATCTHLSSINLPNSLTSLGQAVFWQCRSLTSITIPSSLTVIPEYSFYYCTNLASVSLPNTITHINYGAFAGCKSLSSFTIPTSVTSIGEKSFAYCMGLIGIVIPNSVTNIASSAFNYCTNLATIDFGNSVSTIGNNAFSNCYSLSSIVLPGSVTSIGSGAFCYCRGLQTAFLPNGLTSIPNQMFSECTELTSVNIPNTVTVIGNRSFSECSSLTSIFIPNSVTQIGSQAFHDCISLNTINIPFSVTSIGSSAFTSCALTSMVIPNTITTIPSSLFSGCTQLTSVSIPNSVTTIESSAFASCTSLTSIALPNGLTTIGGYAFYNCTSLENISIPSSVTSIGSNAFSNCGNIHLWNIPSTVTTIGSNAFQSISMIMYQGGALGSPWGACRRYSNWYYENGLYYANSSKTILIGADDTLRIANIPSSVTTIRDSAFYCHDALTSVSIPSSVTTIGRCAFWKCHGLLPVHIPSSVVSLDDYSFAYVAMIFYNGDGSGYALCKNGYEENGIYYSNSTKTTLVGADKSLTEVVIPSSVTQIGDYAFYGHTNLTSVTIPNAVTRIRPYAFQGCTGLMSLTLPSSVTHIESSAFKDCTGLTTISIPNSVIYLGSNAFQNCTSLTSATLSNALTSIGSYIFSGCTSLTFVAIPNSVTRIDSYAFYDCSRLSSLTFGNSVTSIGSNAFSGCKTLTTLTLPNSLTRIDFAAFENCSGLTSVALPNTLTQLGSTVFRSCRNLTNITIPSNVSVIQSQLFEDCYNLRSVTFFNMPTSMGSYSFSNCYKLSHVAIPNSVTQLAYGAFWCCTGLESVTFGNSLSSIGNNVFYCCYSLDSIELPESLSSIEGSAFSQCQNLSSVTMPNAINSIGSFAFCNSSLESIIIPNSVTSLGNDVFEYCPNLAHVKIGNLVPSIGSSTFFSCKRLISVDIPKSVREIGYMAFYGCEKIPTITIPDSVTSIGQDAFLNCTGMSTATVGSSVTSIGNQGFYTNHKLCVTMRGCIPPSLGIRVYYSSNDNSRNTDIYVPDGCLSNYQASAAWMTYNLEERYSCTATPATPHGTVTVDEKPYCVGSIVLTAISDGGYRFVGWSNGVCDSLYELTLTQDTTLLAYFDTAPIYHTVDTVLCDHLLPLQWNGHTLTASTIVSDTLTTASGRDSIVTLNLTIYHATDSNLILWEFPENFPVTVNGISYTIPGRYQQHLTNVAGCDSTLNIQVIQYPDNVDSVICTVGVIENPWDAQVLESVANVHNYYTPLVGDIDGDGIVEIVAGIYPGSNVEAISQIGIFRGTDLHRVGTINVSQKITCDKIGPMAIVRYPNGSGGLQGAIILHCNDSKLRSYDIHGNLLHTSTNNTPCKGAVSIADFNNDGWPEVYVGNAIYDAATLRRLCVGPSGGNKGLRNVWSSTDTSALSFAANVLNDEKLELICGNTIYGVNIVSRTNASLNSISVLKTISLPSRISNDGGIAVVDFDGDGNLEVFVVNNPSHGENTYDSAYYYAYNPVTENILFIHGRYCLNAGFPLIGDIDGDGHLEFVYTDRQTDVHNARITAIKYTPGTGAQVMFQATHTDRSGMTSMTLFDFNQDGIMEIVYRDETALRIINASGKSHLTGNDTLPFYNLYSLNMAAGTWMENPVVAEVNNDGAAEVVVCGMLGTGPGGAGSNYQYRGHLVILGGIHPWAPTRKVWNQYMYNVTNINEDLTTPRYIFDNATYFTDFDGAQYQPYNNFLQQATTLTYWGRPYTAASDVFSTQASIQSSNDVFTITLDLSNQGDNALTAPYQITVYKNTYRGQVLYTQTISQSLPQSGSQTVTISLPHSTLCSLVDVDSLVIALNDAGTGIAQHGNQSPECDTTNNIVTLACPHNSNGTDIQTACESFLWIDGNTYTTSNSTATHALSTVSGCDSIVTLNLPINHSTTGDTTAEACDSFTWYGETYTATTETPTHVGTNVAGCDSTTTLHLTVHYSTAGDTTAVACDNFTWYGTNYTSSTNVPTHHTTNSVGCDSTTTLHLTVNYSSAGDTLAEACDSYTWYGNTYTASTNVPTHHSTNSVGCDSTTTLHLTVHYSTAGDVLAEACDSYTWYGETYTASTNTPTH
ncbi:MAG: leucine-rich repeat protein, partial [Bacteroidales bacterium]|nr:leucine-rich repeat protein [Bacteroidales bacterium]